MNTVLILHWLFPFKSLWLNILNVSVFLWILYTISINLFRAYDARKKIKQYDRELVELHKKIDDAQSKIKAALRQYK